MTSEKALEILEILADNIDYKDYSISTQNLVNGCFGKLEKYIERLEVLEKVLDILKNKVGIKVKITYFGNTPYIDNIYFNDSRINEIEYELLKEVLE